jgi:hypothetical protein
MVPTAITAFLAFCGVVLTAVAVGLARWSKYALIGGAEVRWGLWDFLDSNPLYCAGWVAVTAAMIICALVCFFCTLVVALVVISKKKVAWKTKSFRMIMALLAFLTFLFTILAVVFWICFNEWPACWMNYSDATWANVNATYQYTKYDISWMLACAACGIAMLMTLTAYWSVGKCPKAPPVGAEPVPALYPEVRFQRPTYPTPVSVAYPTTTVVNQYPAYPAVAQYQPFPTTTYAYSSPAYPTLTYA